MVTFPPRSSLSSVSDTTKATATGEEGTTGTKGDKKDNTATDQQLLQVPVSNTGHSINGNLINLCIYTCIFNTNM